MVIAVVIGLAFGTACFVTYLLSLPSSPLRMFDHPSERSLHNAPIPRSGGLGIWAGVAAGLVGGSAWFGVGTHLQWIIASALLVGVISFADDRWNAPVVARLGAHGVAAALLLLAGLGVSSVQLPGSHVDLPNAVGAALTALFVVWTINLYNFMDGMDGLAGTMGLLGFGTLGLLGYLAGDTSFALLCWIVAAAASGFLVWNFPPARIFMGDAGSSSLGLMVAALSLLGDRRGIVPLWLALLVFSPFIIDATVTLILRVLRGERVWLAHRSHYYQRLVQRGWGHKKTLLAECVLMLACGLTAIALSDASVPMQRIGLAAWAGVYAVILVILTVREFKEARASG